MVLSGISNMPVFSANALEKRLCSLALKMNAVAR
jgi:hypothetical protein